MRHFTIYLFCLSFFAVNGQEAIVYYDKDWKVIDKDSAVFYSTVTKAEGEGNYSIADFFISGKPQMTATFKVLNDSIDWTKLYVKGYLDAVKNGECTWYYENGQKNELVTYKMGKMHGKGSEWYENGNLRVEAYFENGKASDSVYIYHENGHLKRRYFMDEGKVRGAFETWYENGQKELATTMIDDFFEGKYERWYENGQKAFESIKKKGVDKEGTVKEWNEDGSLK